VYSSPVGDEYGCPDTGPLVGGGLGGVPYGRVGSYGWIGSEGGGG
jgi:hypothetical protein